MKAIIKFPHTVHIFGRAQVRAQLHSVAGEILIGDESLATILQYVDDEGIQLTNSQEILDLVVRQQGFAA